MEGRNKFTGLLVFFLIVFVIAFQGWMATEVSTTNWYANLKKPEWGPTNRISIPITAVLYFLIALSGWLVWLKVRNTKDYYPLYIFGIQLFLNAIWPWFFFASSSTVMGFVVIVCLFIAILANMAVFWRYNPWASVLLFPYLIWVTFIMSLNFVTAIFNLENAG